MIEWKEQKERVILVGVSLGDTQDTERSLEELEECLSGGNTTEQETDRRLLAQALEAYLNTLSPDARNMFLIRYYFLDSIQAVAAYFGCSESKVKSSLHRTRQGLKKYLEQEGFVL